MRLLKIIPLFISCLIFISCSKDDEETFNPDLSKNALYLNDSEYTLTHGIASLTWDEYPYDFVIVLCSPDIGIDTANTNGDFFAAFSGSGDAISLEIRTASMNEISTGTYSTSIDSGLLGNLEVMIFGDLTISTMEAAHFYEMIYGTLDIKKSGDEYEFTLNGTGAEYNNDETIIKDGINMAAHFKGEICAYNFP